MRAVQVPEPGGPEALQFVSLPRPQPGPRELLVKIHATALNRADLLQRRGKYPAQPDTVQTLGLEMAGEVVALGPDVVHWEIGDRVMALLSGGGYAEYVTIHEEMGMRIPDQLTWIEAAAIPEVFLTAFQALRWLGRLSSGERVLIHAGGSGVGTAAIQLARQFGAEHITVTASQSKHAVCLQLGADRAIDYRYQNFADVMTADHPDGNVDVILDFIGAPYFMDNLRCLRMDGRLVLLAVLGGHRLADMHLLPLLRRRISVIGSTLRARPLSYKIALSREFTDFSWDRFNDGQLQPVIDSVYDWEKVATAHQRMEANQNTGKIVFRVTNS